MVEYKKVTAKLLETALKLRREMLGIIYNKDESEFEGEFTRLSAEYFTNGDRTAVLAFDGEKAVGRFTKLSVSRKMRKIWE